MSALSFMTDREYLIQTAAAAEHSPIIRELHRRLSDALDRMPDSMTDRHNVECPVCEAPLRIDVGVEKELTVKVTIL